MSGDRECTTLGDTIDKLGLRLHLAPDDMVTDVLAIVKVLEPDGSARLALAWSEGMSWIERLGMVTAAQALETPARDGWASDPTGDGA